MKIPIAFALCFTAAVAHGQDSRSSASGGAWTERSLQLPIAGSATAYVPRRSPDGVVLFISGDGGWNLGVVDMARRLAPRFVVIGISFPAVRTAVARQEGCWYPAGDLEVLARNAEKQLGLPEYQPPTIVGYSSGATLAYAAIAGAPGGTFAGAVSLGFCPELEVARQVCAAQAWKPPYDDRKHVSRLPPQARLSADWYLLHGAQDQVCSPAATRSFVTGIGNAHLVEIEKTGHGFSRPAQWGRQFDAAIAALSSRKTVIPPRVPASAESLVEELTRLGLPLEYSIPAAPRAFLVFVTGDGGWASLDRGVADVLRRDNIGVIGWSAVRYFWRAKTPEQMVSDLQRVVTVLRRAGKPILAGGYSFGAEVVPVALARTTPARRPPLAGIVSIAPARTASFEIDPLDWLRTPADTSDRVPPAFDALGLPVLCVRGADEPDSGCTSAQARAAVVTLPGSHHFNGRYDDVAAAIAKFVDRLVNSN
jgi:type IV secretory pathway VirJ component